MIPLNSTHFYVNSPFFRLPESVDYMEHLLNAQISNYKSFLTLCEDYPDKSIVTLLVSPEFNSLYVADSTTVTNDSTLADICDFVTRMNSRWSWFVDLMKDVGVDDIERSNYTVKDISLKVQEVLTETEHRLSQYLKSRSLKAPSVDL